MEVRLRPNIPVGREWSGIPIPGYSTTSLSHTEDSRSTAIPGRSSHSQAVKSLAPFRGPRSNRSFLKPISCLLEGTSYCRTSGRTASTWRAGEDQIQSFIPTSTPTVPYHFLPYKSTPLSSGHGRTSRLCERRIGRTLPRDTGSEGSPYQSQARVTPSHISEEHRLVVRSPRSACPDYDRNVDAMDSTDRPSNSRDARSSWSLAHARIGVVLDLELNNSGRLSDVSDDISRGQRSPSRENFARESTKSTSSFADDTSADFEGSCPGRRAEAEEGVHEIRSSSPVFDDPRDQPACADLMVRKLRHDVRCLSTVPSEASKRTCCRSSGCTRHPRYAKPGEKAEFCSVHKLEGYVDVKHPRCEASDGCVKQPTFGWESEKARFCAAHKLPGMRDVKNPRCAAPGCLKRPRYGDEGERARFCAAHKLGQMVDMASKRDVKCPSPAKRTRGVSRSVPREDRARSFDDPLVKNLYNVGNVGNVGNHKRSKSEGWAEEFHLKLEKSEPSEGGGFSDSSYSTRCLPERCVESPAGETVDRGAAMSPARHIGGRVLDAKEFETCAILLECHSQARVND